MKGNRQPLWAALIGMALFGLFLHFVESGPAEQDQILTAGHGKTVLGTHK